MIDKDKDNQSTSFPHFQFDESNGYGYQWVFFCAFHCIFMVFHVKTCSENLAPLSFKAPNI